MSQTRSLDDVGSAATNSPATQVFDQAVQEIALLASVYVPELQASQTGLLVAVPFVAMNVPWLHEVQVVHDAALFVVEYLPAAHALQVRSVVAFPCSNTNWPGMHSVKLTHALAGFASWSQVPGAQVVSGASPPAQYVPTVHDAQVCGSSMGLGVVWTVPAGQLSCG